MIIIQSSFWWLSSNKNFSPLPERFKINALGENNKTIATLLDRRPCHLNTKGTCEVFFDLINQCTYTYLFVFIFLIIVTNFKPVFVFIFIFIVVFLAFFFVSPRVLCQHVQCSAMESKNTHLCGMCMFYLY